MLVKRLTYSMVMVLMLAGCTQHHSLQAPENPDGTFFGTYGEDGHRIMHEVSGDAFPLANQDCSTHTFNYAAVDYRVDKIISSSSTQWLHPHLSRDQVFYGGLPLSPGDMVSLAIENGDGFNGNYVISASGFLHIPYITPINVVGLPIEQVAATIELALVRAELFQPTTAMISLRLQQLADIEVNVSGAVFEPGRVRINRKIPEQVMEQRITATGDYSGERMLSEALRAASGIRPDAKLDQIMLIRNGWQIQVDMSGIVTGDLVKDIALVANDRIVVPSSGCFQSHLVRPTEITPKGMRVFMSNLIDSAENNASAAVGRYSTNLPYGTRLLQAAVSANCIGGKQWTNAPRKVLLASTNPLNKNIQVVERSVEELMRQAHKTEINPYLMPNDAVACYDSDFTNLRDLARGLVEVIAPLKLM